MVSVAERSHRVSNVDQLERELGRVRAKWIQTIATIAVHKDSCNRIERRRLSRWSSAIDILRHRLERADPRRRRLEDMLSRGGEAE